MQLLYGIAGQSGAIKRLFAGAYDFGKNLRQTEPGIGRSGNAFAKSLAFSIANTRPALKCDPLVWINSRRPAA